MMAIKLEYETPRERRCAFFEPPPPSVLWCSVVLAVALLVHIFVPTLVSHTADAKLAAARIDVQTLNSAIEAFRQDEGRYPTNSESFDVLLEAPSDDSGKWAGPYVSKVPRADPWGHPYVYHAPKAASIAEFDVISYGPDGSLGGGDDISNH